MTYSEGLRGINRRFILGSVDAQFLSRVARSAEKDTNSASLLRWKNFIYPTDKNQEVRLYFIVNFHILAFIRFILHRVKKIALKL